MFKKNRFIVAFLAAFLVVATAHTAIAQPIPASTIVADDGGDDGTTGTDPKPPSPTPIPQNNDVVNPTSLLIVLITSGLA